GSEEAETSKVLFALCLVRSHPRLDLLPFDLKFLGSIDAMKGIKNFPHVDGAFLGIESQTTRQHLLSLPLEFGAWFRPFNRLTMLECLSADLRLQTVPTAKRLFNPSLRAGKLPIEQLISGDPEGIDVPAKRLAREHVVRRSQLLRRCIEQAGAEIHVSDVVQPSLSE